MTYLEQVHKLPEEVNQKYREILDEFLDTGWKYAVVTPPLGVRVQNIAFVAGYYYSELIKTHALDGKIYLERK